MKLTSDGSPEAGQPKTNNHQNNITQSKSYASVISQQSTPKKEQGIVFNSVEDSKLLDYILGVGALVGPKNIIFSSRISNNLVCIYLASKNIADKFISEHKSIIVNDQVIYGRRLLHSD